jgi:hypothetical protein
MTEDIITDWQCKACELDIGELDQPYHCCKGKHHHAVTP